MQEGAGGVMADINFELVCCESMLLREIDNKVFKQKDIAQTYALSMASSECDRIDWKKVNKAIIERWSKSGLIRIKNMAWSGRCWND